MMELFNHFLRVRREMRGKSAFPDDLINIIQNLLFQTVWSGNLSSAFRS